MTPRQIRILGITLAALPGLSLLFVIVMPFALYGPTAEAQEPSTGRVTVQLLDTSAVVSYDEEKQKFNVDKVNDGFIGKTISESKEVSDSLAVVMVTRARDNSGAFRCVILGSNEKLRRGALGGVFLLHFDDAHEDVCLFTPNN